MSKNKRNERMTPLELRCSAGCAPERRGSALLIVIGTLALVAVFAAVYISVGRTDRRAANALKTRSDQRDLSSRAGEYFAGVIGDDRFDAFVQYDTNEVPFAMREVTDAPYTDWSRRSEVSLGSAMDEAVLFTPTGRPYRMDGLDPLTDYRVANDPWLASTTPTYLGFPGDPLFGDERPFGSSQPFAIEMPNASNYLDKRDWLQISNFAPDGRPVNLYNLRPNTPPFSTNTVGQSVIGGFAAEPGFGESERATDGRPIRRMSNYLSLLNVASPGDPQTLLRAFDPGNDGVWVPGYNDPQPGADVGLPGNDVYNTPAVWTMYQRFMFMPMNQPFVIQNRNGDESTWADPDYPAYQYADADGDGFADSRWFELVAARDSGAQGAGGTRRNDIERLLEQGDTRYFFAARAVDLSSMVNVNTATDQLVTPTVEFPMGLTPAEVDLRRLLTMQDAAGNYASVIMNSGDAIPLSMSDAPRPYTTNENLARPYIWTAPERPFDFQRDTQDYQFYQSTVNTSGDPRSLDSNSPAMLIGRYAYSALRRAINLGGTLSNQYYGTNTESGGTQDITDPTQLYQFERDATGLQPDAQQRYEGYLSAGRQYTATTGLTAGTRALFGIDDLSELLTYHGLNDPDFTSRLERVMDGRFDSTLSGLSDPLQARRISPLMSNRDLTLDRFSHGRILSENDMRIGPYPDNPVDISRIGEISPNSMAMQEMTPRKRMTTLSGFVGLRPDIDRRPDGMNYIDASEPLSLTSSDALLPLAGLMQNPIELFRLYSSALAGELEEMRNVGAWNNDLTTRDQQAYSTLFYGHRGPELALRIAAHNAVNTKDLMDSDQEPTVATLLVDNNRRQDIDFDADSNFPRDFEQANPSNQWYRDFPGRASGNFFDPAPDLMDQVVLSDGELDVNRQAVNVYGMEAMPVLTEVASFYVYTDSPIGAGGDDDAQDIRPEVRPNGLVGPIPDEADLERVTINGDVDYANPDMLMQCIAFQLYNPWDEPISLGGMLKNTRPTGQTTTVPISNGAPLTRMRDYNDDTLVDASSGQYQFGYYIEFNGYFFKLAELERYYPPDTSTFNRRSFDQGINAPSNPSTDFPMDGNYLDPAVYPDFIARNVVLQPGETRVFYAMGDHRVDTATASGPRANNLLIDQRWFDTLSQNPAISFDTRPYTDLSDGNGDGVPDFDQDQDGIPDGKDARGWTGPAQEFAENQLSPAANGPVLIHPMNPQTGEYLDTESTVYNFLQTAGSIASFNQLSGTMNRVDPNEVRLWRKITTPGEEENDPGFTNATTQNLLHNDLLVDRMNISDTGVAEPLAAGNNEIEGTIAFPEDYPDTPEEIAAEARNDNTGYTIMRWASTRRKNSGDTAYNGDNYQPNTQETSQIREWLLSSRVNFADSVVSTEDDLPNNPPTIEDFRDGVDVASAEVDAFYEYNSPSVSDYERWRTLLTMFQGPSVVVTVDQAPFVRDQLDNRYPNNGVGSSAKFNEATSPWLHPDSVLHAGDTANDPVIDITYDANTIRPQLPSANGVNGSQPRLADLLLSMGIGPTFAPSSPGSLDVAVAEYNAEEWMTFPEALAIALGYVNPSATPATLAAESVWHDTWRPSTELDQRVLDDGRLALDRFVPFINNTIEDPIEFIPGSDVLRGAGVPLAAGVVDRARAISAVSRVTDRRGTSGDTPETLLTHATFGTININTAPVEVLRLLPGLSPSRAEYVHEPSSPTSTQDEWWGKRLSDVGVTDLTANTNMPNLDPGSAVTSWRENPDIAAAIVAYRDRNYGFPNTAARPEPATNAGTLYLNAPLFLSVETSNLLSVAQNFIGETPPITDPSDGNFSMDRETFSGIDGLRTTPGFGSLGELFAVRLDPEFNGGGSNGQRWNMLRHMSIDQLGYDERAQGVAPNADGDPVTAIPELFTGSVPGNTVDDYAEKLAIANGVLNMISVRSDYYAVWFVVHGYRESDVANLRPEEPLIPSLQKRYIMVVDRSNVVEVGDQPKILLLKEVPL